MIRILILAAGALVGGAAVSRKLIDRKVRYEIDDATRLARAAAISELNSEVSGVVRQRIVASALSAAWKVAIVAAAYFLYDGHELTADGFRIIVVLATAIFAARDVYLVAPHLYGAYLAIRGHKWRPQAALREFVAGVVFDRAYERALAATAEPGIRSVIAWSSFTREDISKEVAESVSDVARQASVEVVRWRAALGAGAVAIFTLLYGAFLTLAFQSL